MLLNIILIIVLVVCLAIVVFIVWRKLPKLKTLDPNTVPEEVTAKAWEKILVERMKRKGQFSRNVYKEKVAPVLSKTKKFFKRIANRVYELEKKYQKEAREGASLSGQDAGMQINHLIEESNALIRENKYAEAEKKLIEAVGLDPKNINVYESLVDIYINLKEYKQALQTIMFVLKLESKKSQILTKEDENGKIYKVTSNAHQLSELYSQIGKIYELLGNSGEARINYSKALDLESNSPRNLDQIIKICIILKQKLFALDYLARLESVNPENQKLSEYREEIGRIG